MPPFEQQFVVKKRSWDELINHARCWYNTSRKEMNTSLHHFSIFVDESGTERLLALGGHVQSAQQCIYTGPLTKSSLIASPSTLSLIPYMVAGTPKGPLPPELVALCERQRTSLSSGITSYEYDSETSTLLYSDSSKLFFVQGTNVRQVGESIDGCPLNAQLCPVDSSFVSFVANGAVHIDWMGRVIYSTTPGESITDGHSSFVVQEELDRYDAIWWSPGPSKMLLYERVDETEVTELQFTCPGRPPNKPMKYPMAGTPNALSSLRLISIEAEVVHDNELRVDLKTLYPWYEYLCRVGWLPDGSAVWAILLSRLQERFALILIPITLFGQKSDNSSNRVITIMQNERKIWYNADNLTHFLHSECNNIIFITSNDLNDYTHLFLCTAEISDEGENISCKEMQLTSGDWSVAKESGLHVDLKRRHVYFLANKQHPLITSMCVTCYDKQTESKILTDVSLSCRTGKTSDFNLVPDIGFVCWLSSVYSPPQCVFYRLQHQNDQILPIAILQHVLHLPSLSPFSEKQLTHQIEYEIRKYPEIIEYYSKNSQKKHYALLLRPFGAIKGYKYPVMQIVYGGPGVQFVRNSWATWIGLRKYASLGYAVLMVDGRGSANRGITFEAEIKNRFVHFDFSDGTIEIADQIEGLNEIASRTDGLLDLKRVVVMGWSYGGYLSLLCLAKHPDIFRAAIVGGAVTCWELYDTAYTERYLGLPNDQIYEAASVLNYIKQLPNETDRLLIFHGLMDENVHFTHTEHLIEALISASKPYHIHVFPSERHGVRSQETKEFFDATVLSFLQRTFCPSSSNT